MEERIYTVNLTDAYEAVRTKRARRSVKLLRLFVARHSKTDDVALSEAVNSFLWSHSMQKPPRRIKVRVVKEGEAAKAYLLDEKVPKKETKKEEKPAEKEAKKETHTHDKPETHAKESKKEPAAEKKETHAHEHKEKK